jgi:phosphate transport system protein
MPTLHPLISEPLNSIGVVPYPWRDKCRQWLHTMLQSLGLVWLHRRLSVQQNHQLKQKLLLMASNAEECVLLATRSLLERQPHLAEAMKSQDDIIDQLEKEVDQQAISMLADATQPEAIRFISMAMRISNELERVGDEATTISRRSLELMKHEPLRLEPPIQPMADKVTTMLRSALDAFVYRRPNQAREIILQDKEVDLLNKTIQAEMTERMLDHPEEVVRCLQYMTIAKSMERIGDHASNIAEQVVFLYEAKDIRHE